MKRRGLLVLLVFTLALLGALCGDDDDGGSSTNISAGETTIMAALFRFEAGITMVMLQAKGKIVVGIKFNQLGFGFLNFTIQKPEGFDVEIVKLIAVGIFGGDVSDIDDKIEFKETIFGVRELVIQNGEVDIVVVIYTINDIRKIQVDFVGLYVIDGQTVMVKSDNTTIKALADLNGKKVCIGKGSTTFGNFDKLQIKLSELVLRDTYLECVDELRQGWVEAMVIDRGILLGLVFFGNGAFKLVDIDISEEFLGIGLKKGDDAFWEFLNIRLEEIYKSGEWVSAYERIFGKLGLATLEFLAVNRYVGMGTAITLATTTSTIVFVVTTTTAFAFTTTMT